MYDWNDSAPSLDGQGRVISLSGGPVQRGFARRPRPVKVVDETLRDGLQSAAGVQPDASQKIDLLYAMAAIGVDVVSVGLPAAAGRSVPKRRRSRNGHWLNSLLLLLRAAAASMTSACLWS